MSGDLVSYKLSRAEKLWQRRSNWESEWIDLGDYVVPRKSLLIRGAIYGSQTARKIYSSTAPKAAHDLSSTMQGTLTNQAIRWFYLRFPDSSLNKNPEAAKWLELFEEQMLLFKQQSNMSSEYSELYLDLVSFATSATLLEMSQKATVFGFRYKTLTLGEYAIAEDPEGDVNTLYRRFEMTVSELVRMFGDKVSQKVKGYHDERKYDQRIMILHAVEPQDEKKVSRSFVSPPDRRPFLGCYIECGERRLLRTEGFYTFPYLVGRWSTNSNEEYGRGPGHIALPDIKSLNRAIQLKFRAVSKDLDPPHEVLEKSVLGPVELLPSSLNYVRQIPSISPIASGHKVDIATLNETDLKQGIKEIFYSDLTSLPPMQGTPVSATEAAQRFEIMERKLGPTIGRVKTEILKKDIDRSVDMMIRAQVVPPPPAIVQEFFKRFGVKIDVEFEGPLERAQRASEVSGISNTYLSLAPIAQLKPEVLDVLDHDGAARQVATLSGWPQSLIVPQDQVDAIRAERNKQAQEVAQAEQAETMARAAKAGAGAVAELSSAAPAAPGV